MQATPMTLPTEMDLDMEIERPQIASAPSKEDSHVMIPSVDHMDVSPGATIDESSQKVHAAPAAAQFPPAAAPSATATDQQAPPRIVKIHLRRYTRAELADRTLKKTGFYTTGSPIAGPNDLKGMVDKKGISYCKARGDILMFDDLETLRVFVSRYMGDVSAAPNNSAPVGMRGLDLRSLVVAWKKVPGTCDLTYATMINRELFPATLNRLLGISQAHPSPLFRHMPRPIGRLLEVVEQLGNVKEVTLVYATEHERDDCRWGQLVTGDAIQAFFLPIFVRNWKETLNNLWTWLDCPVYTWMRMQKGSWNYVLRFNDITEKELLAYGVGNSDVEEEEMDDSDDGDGTEDDKGAGEGDDSPGVGLGPVDGPPGLYQSDNGWDTIKDHGEGAPWRDIQGSAEIGSWFADKGVVEHEVWDVFLEEVDATDFYL
ncbi:uncharacterized protein L3040_006867 [Drepanopeziza brunnea f. sp. 'multigermtubi']|uniref:uncharacterized protein n=1 Tax=Drepanopeziza brunnea f. sp. 'multigermtubi' TaxID=698441 RepID=UPI00238BDA2D|nr:hypothetical protein L3040_006867 [Drepanopeziza brunnea f. sp. 'multigermtubi']